MSGAPHSETSNRDDAAEPDVPGPEPRPKRSRVVLGLAGIGIVAAALAGAARLERRDMADPPSCRTAAAVVERLWGPGSRRRVAAAVEEAASPAEAAGVLEGLDAYARRWRWAATDNCRARLAGARDAAEAEERSRCLERRSELFATAIALLGESPRWAPDTPSRTTDLVAALRPISDCELVRHTMYEQPPPANPNRAAQTLALRRPLAEAELLVRIGECARARRILDDAAGRVRALAHAPTQAEHGLWRLAARQCGGPVPPGTETATVEDAARLAAVAEAAGDDPIAGWALALEAETLDPGPERARLLELARGKATRSHDEATSAVLACIETSPSSGPPGTCAGRVIASEARPPTTSTHRMHDQ